MAGPERPMSFVATLINAQPPGEIQSTGSFGPWQRDQPAETPVSGKYVFRHADLSVFHGISGSLYSDGNYRGVLERIEVQGHTDIPDFAVTIAGNPVHLTTDFHALVDGTNGTTHLQPVVARFGHSSLTAQGVVDTTPGEPGKIISLDVRSQDSRLEDMLRMAVKGKPALSGAVAFHTKLRLPIVGRDVSQELELDGTFDATSARFSKQDEQQKVDKLSNRGRGQTDDAADDSVASDFRGRFKLRDGVMHFTDLSFLVPGVAITLNGDYGLADGHMDLTGTARLQAKLSQTTTGFKSFLLKAVDPFFEKKGAGTVLPIKISWNAGFSVVRFEYRAKSQEVKRRFSFLVSRFSFRNYRAYPQTRNEKRFFSHRIARRRNPFLPQINFRIAAMMRGVNECVQHPIPT